MNQVVVIPTPGQTGPLPERVPAQEDGPSWYFLGFPLVF